MVNHPNRKKPDPRYTIAREYCGHDTPRWVVRFCREFIGQSAKLSQARDIAREHSAERMAEALS